MFTEQIVEQAYCYLKNYVYHENLNLFLKQRVAQFECEPLFKENLSQIAAVLSAEQPLQVKEFQTWLKTIDFHILPKAITRPEDAQQNQHNESSGLFISNVRTSSTYQVDKVNYWINAPVQLHIIEVLWCLYAGAILDKELTKDCYGNRLHKQALSFTAGEFQASSGTQTLFTRYVDQYNRWRDQAIDKATELSKSREDVVLLSLDLKSYFYQIDLQFDDIKKLLKNQLGTDSELAKQALLLTELLERVFLRYNQVIQPHLKLTHYDCCKKQGLPIGLASSSIIANWYLSEFDSAISDSARPDYYGRYVDDMIFVFKRPTLVAEQPIANFVSQYLKGLLVQHGNKFILRKGNNKLPIQQDKLILQYFDKAHSRAGLEIFKQELDERSSAFKFLPGEHINGELDKFAYDILYNGSANKLRSIVGLAENETELAKYLSSHIIAHRLCKLDKKDVVLPQLALFFKGANALQFSRLWEKVYQYAIVLKNYNFIRNFFKNTCEEICKISLSTATDNETLTTKLKTDLQLYNQISLAICLALLAKNFWENWLELNIEDISFLELPNGTLEIRDFAKQFRNSNLIRHHLVAWPLANFSDFDGDLTEERKFISSSIKDINEERLKLSPRFIHIDEWQLFYLAASLTETCRVKKQQEYFEQYIERYAPKGLLTNYSPIKNILKNIHTSTISIDEQSLGDKLKIAIANLIISEKDISAAMRKDQSPNVSFERQEKLYHILNSAIKEQIDLLVMPEVAIPVSWLPFMVGFSRRHQIGLVFGLEHWVKDDVVFNLQIEALPFKTDNTYKSAMMIARLKNHYAPAELALIKSLRLKPAICKSKYYHKVHWRGISFASYNCFELSDIDHRALFRSEIDLLLACVWNKDTNYYEHILESAVRDIHCYVVQSNTSQYGGSCVLQPSKTETKKLLYVKGGTNTCLLTAELDIAALRDFQYKSTCGEQDRFKNLPPGFDSEKVLERTK